MDRELHALETLRAAGRVGSAVFAACCAERLRPLLSRVPSGAPPLLAGVALTELWRVLEGLQRPDPRRLRELSETLWTMVEIEPVPEVRTELLEALVAAAHDALETYLLGNAQHAAAAAKKVAAVAGPAEPGLQDADLADIAGARSDLPALATRLRRRAEGTPKKK